MLETVEARYKKHFLNLDVVEVTKQSEDEEASIMDLELVFSLSHKVANDELKSYINQPKLERTESKLSHAPRIKLRQLIRPLANRISELEQKL